MLAGGFYWSGEAYIAQQIHHPNAGNQSSVDLLEKSLLGFWVDLRPAMVLGLDMEGI